MDYSLLFPGNTLQNITKSKNNGHYACKIFNSIVLKRADTPKIMQMPPVSGSGHAYSLQKKSLKKSIQRPNTILLRIRL